MKGRYMLIFLGLLIACIADAQSVKLRGTVTDAATGEPIVSAVVKVKEMVGGAVTDLDGHFELTVDRPPPFTLMVIYFGYASQNITVTSLDKDVQVKLVADAVMLKEAEVVRQRISDKQKQAPLTVETMDLIGIKEVPGGDFYEGLGNLKGVDMTAASFGFKVINTRGFNSTSPVRSLQLIDGVDNQSPGLNFSLGNFLGASDLDVMKVDVIAGASTAYYGPGAFNGVINMTTKSPWTFPGLSVSVKGGERNMLEAAVRWAEVIKDKNGKPRWAYKLNAYALRADDWPAENYAPTSNSPTDASNPGRYDAVNIYGDEDVSTNNDYANSNLTRSTYPGLGKFLRNGYKESDLVDYGTRNMKVGGSVHYRINDSLEVIAASNFSTGSTVYQGDNRYQLKDIKFFQHRLELRREGTWFVRAYLTHEDAGQTYDIYTTALRLQDAQGSTKDWNTVYNQLWGQSGDPNSWISSQVLDLPGYIPVSQAPAHGLNATTWPIWQDQFIQDNLATFQYFHQVVMDSVNSLNSVSQHLNPFYVPGTDRFNEKFDEITHTKFTDGGSMFYDKSMLAHVAGEYKFKPTFGVVTVGGNFREYMPNTAGTIFSDTGNVTIRNSEFGIVGGVEKKLMQDRLTATLTARMDKNENFQALFSPALSLVYAKTPAHVWRVGFNSAIRNPTLADQYLYYNVGRALLLGNVSGQFESGRDSMFTIDSFNAYRDSPNGLLEGLSKLDYFNVDRVRPEQVKTVEIGYRGTHWKNVYFDIGAYNSWYTDFIGYIIGLHAQFDPTNGFPIGGIQAYRVAANATSQVTTQGVNAGMTWYRPKLTYTFNYSYNRLTSGADDPIIPAFNTPRNKFNAGFSARERKIPFTKLNRFGYGLNWKYVEGYSFEGSPQFSGPIPSYDMVDAQINVSFPKDHLTLKVGGSNLFGLVPFFDNTVPSDERLNRAWNNDVYLVYGGPRIGRLAYVQISYELDKR